MRMVGWGWGGWRAKWIRKPIHTKYGGSSLKKEIEIEQDIKSLEERIRVKKNPISKKRNKIIKSTPSSKKTTRIKYWNHRKSRRRILIEIYREVLAKGMELINKIFEVQKALNELARKKNLFFNFFKSPRVIFIVREGGSYHVFLLNYNVIYNKL